MNALGRWSRANLVPIATIVIGIVIRVPQLGHTLAEMHSFRQTQTAMVARAYGRGDANLFHTPLTVFGSRSDVPMELPLVQELGGLLVRLGIPSDLAMRLIGLASFEVSVALLIVLVTRWHGRRIAAVLAVVVQFSPFALAWGAASLIEFSAVALSLGMVLAIDRWFDRGGVVALAIGSVCAWAAYLVKVTTAPTWTILLVASALYVILRRGWRASWRRLVIGMVAAPGVGLVLAGAWTVYADRVKSAEPLTRFLTSSALRDWNFGTLPQREQLANYLVIASRLAGEMAGPLVVFLVAGVVAAAFGHGAADRIRRLSWLAVAAAAPLVFFNLYVVHNYYLCAIYEAVAVLAAFAVDGLLRLIERVSRRPAVVSTAGGVAVAALLASTAFSPLGRTDLHQWLVGAPVPGAATAIDQESRAGQRIVMIGCDWDPTIAYYADRTVVMFRGADSQGFWGRTAARDYSYLYDCGAGPGAPARYLPASAVVVPTGSTGLFRIVSRN